MAIKVRQPQTVSEKDNFRASEAFNNSVESILKLVGSVTATVGSIAAGGIGTVTIPVTGAKPDQGMTVQVGLPSAINVGLLPWAYVSGDDIVTMILYNRTGSPIVLGEMTFHCRVMP